MATIKVVALGLALLLLVGEVVETRRLKPGNTYQFDHDGFRYWLKIDWMGRYPFSDARMECESLHHGAQLVKINGSEQYRAIQVEVRKQMPEDWSEVMLWTSDSNTPGTHQVLVIWRSRSYGTNSKENHASSYRIHGYICQRRYDGETHQFEYDGYRYWAIFNRWVIFRFTDARRGCKRKYGAEVATITSNQQYSVIQSEVEKNVSANSNGVNLWTGDSNSPGARQMLVIRTSQSVNTNTIENHEPGYPGQGYICQRRIYPIGSSHQFDFEGTRYWFKIDWWGNFSYHDAVRACTDDYDAEVATARDTDVYYELRKQIEHRIPIEWEEVMLWTGDKNIDSTHAMLVVWKTGTGGPVRTENHRNSYKGHGYICQRGIQF